MKAFYGAALAIAVLSAAACSGSSGETGAGVAPPADLGARLYTQNCLPCHHDDGAGVPTVYPSLIASPIVNGDPTELTQWVLSGKRPKSMPAGRYSTQMLLFGWMKDADAAALLTYIRSNFGNHAAPLDAAAVAKARP
jgi:mono/diheme cytochrome c family protein